MRLIDADYLIDNLDKFIKISVSYDKINVEDKKIQVVAKIDAVPTVQMPNSFEWIPVSERLPEKTDYYLIQYSREVCPDEMAVAFYSVEEAGVDSNYTWEFKPIADCKEVIAWMPLPASYKPPKMMCEED